MVLLFALVAGVLAVGIKTPTGAAITGGFSFGSIFGTTYSCGDDYPADADEVMDLSDCVADEEETKNNLFCYVNNTVTADEISPNSSNDDWYLTNAEEDISSISSIDTVALLESSIVFPWSTATEAYDNVDCFSWSHGITRTEEWHLCNETELQCGTIAYYVIQIYKRVQNGFMLEARRSLVELEMLLQRVKKC